MSTESSKRIIAAALMLVAVACGSKKPEPDNKDAEKKGTVSTPNPSDNKTDPAPVAAGGSVIEQVQDSASMVFFFPRPEQSFVQGKAFLDRVGVPNASEDFKRAAEELKTKAGLDISDPEMFKKIGLDPKRGFAFAADASITVEKPYHDEYSGVLEVRRSPLLYFTVGTTDDKTFVAWLKDTDAKNSGKLTLEEATLGDAKVNYLYEPSPSDPSKKRLNGAIVQRNNVAQIFVLDGSGLQKLDLPEAKDPIPAFQENLKTFLAKSAPITKSANYLAATKNVDANGDMLFYFDSAKLAAAVSLDRPEFTLLPPKDDTQKKEQDFRKTDIEARKESDAKDDANLKILTDLVPALAFSATLEPNRISMKGSAFASPAAADKLGKIFVPAVSTPAYATLLPEGTTLFYRYSVSPSGILAVLRESLPADVKAEFDKGFAEASTAINGETGLDLETDLLGGFTGHVAFAGPNFEALVTPFFAMMAGGGQGKLTLPPMFALAQVSTPAAGDKLLNALEAGLKKAGMPFPVKTEDVNGEKLYTVDAGEVAISWGRTADLLVLSNDAQALKDLYAKTKAPGANFADKLGSSLAKELVNSKAASGATFELGSLLGVIAMAPDSSSPAEKEIISKLAGIFGTTTFLSEFKDGAMVFSGEVILK